MARRIIMHLAWGSLLLPAFAASAQCWEVALASTGELSGPNPLFLTSKFDSEGNRYFARSFSGEMGFALTKMDALGARAWEIERLGDTNFRYLNLADFATDSAGATFMTSVGATNFYTDSEDVITWKVDTDGNPIWTARYLSRGFPHGVAPDNSGGVCVVGTTAEGTSSIGTAKPPGGWELLRYGADGQRLWRATYEPGGYGAEGSVVATGPNGDVYVAGRARSTDPHFEWDLVLAKYDPNGGQLWLKRRGYFQMYPPRSLFVDSQRNIFVGISFYRGAPFDDHITVKFNPAGDLIWTVYHSEPSEINATAARALDAEDNIYVALISAFDKPISCSKYDRDGNRLWSTVHAWTDERFVYGDPALRVNLDGDVSVTVLSDPGPTIMHYIQNTTPGRPIIHTELQPRRVASGSTVTFTILATGVAPLSYQWLREGLNIGGTTNTTLILSNVTPSDTGKYSVMVTNAIGCAIAPEIILTVVEVQPFYFSFPRVTSNTFSFMFVGEPARLYWIDSSTNLSDWSPVFGFVGASSSPRELTISRGLERWRFLRARTDP